SCYVDPAPVPEEVTVMFSPDESFFDGVPTCTLRLVDTSTAPNGTRLYRYASGDRLVRLEEGQYEPGVAAGYPVDLWGLNDSTYPRSPECAARQRPAASEPRRTTFSLQFLMSDGVQVNHTT